MLVTVFTLDTVRGLLCCSLTLGAEGRARTNDTNASQSLLGAEDGIELYYPGRHPELRLSSLSLQPFFRQIEMQKGYTSLFQRIELKSIRLSFMIGIGPTSDVPTSK